MLQEQETIIETIGRKLHIRDTEALGSFFAAAAICATIATGFLAALELSDTHGKPKHPVPSLSCPPSPQPLPGQ